MHVTVLILLLKQYLFQFMYKKIELLYNLKLFFDPSSQVSLL